MSREDQTRAYRDLVVWQKAMDLVPMAYDLARRLPREEQFGLTSQIQLAAVSVPANIDKSSRSAVSSAGWFEAWRLASTSPDSLLPTPVCQ